jgi:hypothetical protein
VILWSAMGADDSLPDDVTTLKAMLRAERAARLAAEAESHARTLLIEKLKLTIKKLRHEQFGQSSERGALLDQLELQLADLEANAAQAETAAQMAAAGKSARAREVRLPGLRSDHPTSGPLAPDCARACGVQVARPYPVRQIRPAPAAQSSERRLSARRHRSRCVDARRLGGRRSGNPDAAR